MYKDISVSLSALMDLKHSVDNNKVCKEQIENLSAGLQNDNISILEDATSKRLFNPNRYSHQSTSISIDDARYLVESAKSKMQYLVDDNRKEAISTALHRIKSLISCIQYLTEGNKNIDLDILEKIKNYFNRPKVDVFISQETKKLENNIELNFIPLSLLNNQDQLNFFKSLIKDNSTAEDKFERLYDVEVVNFFPLLNWLSYLIKDGSSSTSDGYNFEIFYNNMKIAPIDVFSIAEAISDGRLVVLLNSIKATLEKDLEYLIIGRSDVADTFMANSEDIGEIPDSFKYSASYDKLFKDGNSYNFIEFLYSVLFK